MIGIRRHDLQAAVPHLEVDLPRRRAGRCVELSGAWEGGLRGAAVFQQAEGAGWIDTAGHTHGWPEWREWLGKRRGG
jgi:hypothetical protein